MGYICGHIQDTDEQHPVSYFSITGSYMRTYKGQIMCIHEAY